MKRTVKVVHSVRTVENLEVDFPVRSKAVEQWGTEYAIINGDDSFFYITCYDAEGHRSYSVEGGKDHGAFNGGSKDEALGRGEYACTAAEFDDVIDEVTAWLRLAKAAA